MPDLPTTRAEATDDRHGTDTGRVERIRPRRLLRLLGSNLSGRSAVAIAVARVLLGGFFLLASTSKFPFSAYYEEESAAFSDWGLPDSALFVILVGLLEMTSGLLLIIGFGTRVAAAALAVTMVGAVVTAGVQDGGFFHLGIAPAMFFAMMILVWTGAGTASFDARLTAKLRG